ncbi:MAG: WcaI family glycosyltransferase [Anaerolineales bacterium]
MKILVLGLNFPPEIISIGKYTGEMVDFLAAQGVELRVITAPPYFPQWKILPGYSGWRYQRERRGAVQIWRCPLWVPRRVSGISRSLHLLSFALSSLPAALAQLRWKPDVVLCVIPTLPSAINAWLLARLSGAKAWLHIQDFELDVAFGLKMLPGANLLRRAAQTLETFILTRFERVSTISEKMLALARQKGVPADKTRLFPNWVDSAEIHPLPGPNPLRQKFRLPEQAKIVLYHGSMGHKQGLEIVEKVARLLEKSAPDIFFLLCGDGAARPELESAARGLPNLKFLPLQPPETLNLLVNLADIHLLPQRGDAADLVMPSKLTSMLASGKAVIACARPDSQIGEIVGQVGLLSPPEDAAALAEAILALSRSPTERARLGQAGRRYAETHLDRQIILNNFLKELREM